MSLGLDKMLNQIRRLWADKGADDKDFTPEELKLKEALNNLKVAADVLSKAATDLLDLIRQKN
jgi:hypothetical protein